MMGGEIEVESEKGGGSTFHFSVCLGEPLAGQDPAPAIRGIPAPAGMRVLVVDDNRNAREIAAELLGDLGYRVEAAESGERAIERFGRSDRDGRFGLVLLDLSLPGIDGLETIRRMRTMPSAGEGPVVFIATGSMGEDTRFGALDAGADNFLPKPLTRAGLAAALRKCFSADAKAGRQESGKPHAVARRLAGLRILVVEDNEINRQVAAELLEAEGAEVTEAFEGRSGVDKVLAPGSDFDAVLLDIQMPGMDGFQAARLIRADGRFGDLPIIAMTAYAMTTDHRQILDAGMDDHIPKPVDPEMLVATLERRCGKKTHERVPAQPAPMSASDPRLSGMKEFDIPDVMQRLMGNRALFLKLLRKFAGSERDTADRIRRAIEAGDLDAALVLAHTLKGVAGNLGAKSVQADAAALEAALRARVDDGGYPEPALRDSLARAISEVDSLP